MANLDKNKISLAIIVDMYAHNVTGGFLQPKYVSTYLKLKLPKQFRSQVIKGDFKIPIQDVQSGYIKIGKKILIYIPAPDKVVYLGPEGDWETMMNEYGVHPNVFKTLPQDFSESERIVKDDYHVTIYGEDGKVATEFYLSEKGAYNVKFASEEGKKLFKEYIQSRGLNTFKNYTID